MTSAPGFTASGITLAEFLTISIIDILQMFMKSATFIRHLSPHPNFNTILAKTPQIFTSLAARNLDTVAVVILAVFGGCFFLGLSVLCIDQR